MPKLIQLTDMHLTPPGTTLHGVDMAARLAAVIAHIAFKHADADAVILTGDLVDDRSEASYRLLRAALDGLPPCPRHFCLGNHDGRDGFRRVFPEVAFDGNGFAQWAASLGGHLLIGLDTLVEGSDAGALGPERLGFLREALSASTAPVLLFLHHLPFRNGIRRFDATMLADGDALWAALAPHRSRVRHMFMGHTHRLIAGSWRGLPFTVSPGTCLPSLLDFTSPAAERLLVEPSFTVILVEGDDLLVHVEQLPGEAKIVRKAPQATEAVAP